MIPEFRKAAMPTSRKTAHPASRKAVIAGFRKAVQPALLMSVLALSGCNTFKPPQISYDDDVPPLPALPAPTDDRPRPLHVPPAWAPAHGGKSGAAEAKEPAARVETANDAARVEPRRDGYFNAEQIFPYSPGALYQVYAAPGQITDIALQQGEQLTGSGPVAAGDTVRWVIGDTESGSGDTRRVHIMVKPTRSAIETNLIVNTDRRTYLIELRSREHPYLPSVAWAYPDDRTTRARSVSAIPILPEASQRRYRRSKATIPLGGPSTPMTMAARSISSSRAVSHKARCRRYSSSAPTARLRSSTTAASAMS